MLSATSATSSQSLEMLPLCDLLAELQCQALIKLDTYLFEQTLQINNELNKAFAEARQIMEGYLQKSTLMGMESAFNGFISVIEDDCHEPANALTSQHRRTLVELIKVYKAYALQQFGIKKTIEQIRELEFSSPAYTKANRYHAATEAIISEKKAEKFVASLKTAIASFNIGEAVINNDITNAYRQTLAQINETFFQRLEADEKALKHAFWGIFRKQYEFINTKAMELAGEFKHELPNQVSLATDWIKNSKNQLAILQDRRHHANTPELLAAVEEDVSLFIDEFKQNKNKFLQYEDALNQQLRTLCWQQKDYLNALHAEKSKIAGGIAQTIARLGLLEKSDKLPLPVSNLGLNVAELSCFQVVESVWVNGCELKLTVKRLMEDLVASIKEINDYLKSSLAKTNIQGFDGVWENVFIQYQSIINTKMNLDGLKLEKAQLEQIRQFIDMTNMAVKKVREVDVQTEISCIQRDAHTKYVGIYARLVQLSKLLESPENQYHHLVDSLFGRIWDELEVLYKDAQATRAEKVRQISVSLYALNHHVTTFNPAFMDLPDKPAVVFNRRAISVLETQIAQLQSPKQLRKAAATVYDHRNKTESNSEPQARGFLRRYWMSLATTTAAGLAGAGIGCVLGWFFAPVTLGLSVPVLAGIGAAAGFGVGIVAGLTTCMVLDKCKKCTENRSTDDTSPGDVAAPRQVVTLSSASPMEQRRSGVKAGSSPRLFQPAVPSLSAPNGPAKQTLTMSGA